MDKGYAPIADGRLYYEISGSGFPLVLIHGFSFDTRVWKKQVEDFSPFYQVIAYDLRGFGKSSLPREDYTHAGDLKVLLDYLNIGQAHLVGHSLGGDVVLDFVAEYPEYVKCLVLVDAGVHGYTWSKAYKKEIEWFKKELKNSGRSKSGDLFLQLSFYKSLQDKPELLKEVKNLRKFYSGWHWEHDNPWVRPEPPAIKRLHEITKDTLVVIGEQEVPDFIKLSSLLSREIPQARLEIISDAGHMVTLEQPEIFRRLVLEFLQLHDV
ncbi:MAG TPA: alpha/beta hydrolase [Candidatus Dojkabacteria bacterium]|nr:alpha/beta hydrolase [Candidatus Dojkabacteria bacterium]